MKGADFGKAIGIDRPANVKDKIKKWQIDLNAEPEAPAEAAPESPAAAKPPPSPKPPSTPKAKAVEDKPSPKPAYTPAKSIEATPDRPKSAKKPLPAHNPLDDELQIATAPKKRVVSDSHWRNKTSPPKNPTKKTSPKQLPTAWVRPAVRKAVEKAAEEQEKEKEKEKAKEASKPKATSPVLTPNPLLIFTPKMTPQAQKARAQRQRRLSRPASAGNDERPVSSGSGSGKNAKSGDEGVTSITSPPTEKEDTELVRVRRRPRARTSPRESQSAERARPLRTHAYHRSETALSEDPANLITVEYEPSESEAQVRDAIRERRRKSRRKVFSDVSGDSEPEVKATDDKDRRKPRLRSQFKEERDPPFRHSEPTTPATPPQKLGSRLEMWLQATPDPVDGADTRRRRKSKDSVSTLELPPAGDKTDVSASTDVKEPPLEVESAHISDSRRRRKKRSSTAPIDIPVKEETSVVSSVTPTESSITEMTEDGLSPTPTLKRRGARRTQHSPTKDRVMSLPSRHPAENDEEVASAAPSSSIESQSTGFEKVTLDAPYESPAMRRLFPSTGQRLSTIVSVDTFATKMQRGDPSELVDPEPTKMTAEKSITTAEPPASDTGSQLRAETSTIVSRRSTKRSRLASHADLISVLSMPKTGTKSIMSARSIRTNRSRLATATIGDIMNELALDESKYMRELRTLVDGVIPVLLSCVLSKSDSAVAAGLFNKSSTSSPTDVTKPIVDMGVSLERLKTLHKRVPKEDSDAFLSWAQSAQRVYTDYIAAWRLGFQDVVISLASADEDPFKPAKVVEGAADGAPWDEGMPRNAEGYVVNGDGERVDVAYMLKRPLVRLKYLAKTIKVSRQSTVIVCHLLTFVRESTILNPQNGQRKCGMFSKISLRLLGNAQTTSTHALKMRPLQPLILHDRGILAALRLSQVSASTQIDAYVREIILIYTCIIRVDKRSIVALKSCCATTPLAMATVVTF